MIGGIVGYKAIVKLQSGCVHFIRVGIFKYFRVDLSIKHN